MIVESSSSVEGNDPHNTVAPIPDSMLIVNSADNTTADTLDNDRQVMVYEGAI